MNKVSPTYRCLLAVLFLLIYSITTQAQEPIGDVAPEVKVMARATKNSIMLRWAVNTPTSWKYTNEFGFTIERKTITRGGQILPTPEVTMLTTAPILPKPMAEWEAFSETSNNAAIAVQALYGESFAVDMEGGGNAMVSIVNQAAELEQRFSFALFAADQEYEVAKFSGLAYVDNSVLPGEQYLYTIATAIPAEKILVKSGGVYIGLQDHQPLPQPLDFTAIFNDGNAMLSWNYVLLKRQYNNYIVERSDDNGASFQRLDAVPIANMGERSKNPSDRMFYVDSLPQNNKEYQYRIQGISPFGETGPMSDIIKGSGLKALAHNPAILEASLSENKTGATIRWEFPEEGMATLSHFEVNRSETVKNGYQTLPGQIAASKRQIEVGDLQGINYFTITAVGKDGSKRESFPKMIQLDDTTPPAIPIALEGTVDSTGVVYLQWQQNVESDFLGYRVFRANREEEEFTQVTSEPVAQSKFTDTVNIKMLNSQVYYKIQAFDQRYNPSNFSEVLALKKPDIIPPTQPVFESFTVEERKVNITFIPSSSEDALKTLFYRKIKGKKSEWTLAGEVALPTTEFEDTDIQPGTTYLYTMLTMDSSGLESTPMAPLSVTTDKGKTPEVDRFTGTVNIEGRAIQLRWRYSAGNVAEYSLFKAEDDGKLTLYKVFEKDTDSFLDTKLKINSTYTFGIQALLSDGSKSPIKIIEVEY